MRDARPRGPDRRGFGLRQEGVETSDSTGTVQAAATRPLDLGQDRFADLYRAVQSAQQLGVRAFGFQAAEAIQRQAALDAGTETAGYPQGLRQPSRSVWRRSDEAVAELAAAARWATNLLDDPITSFVGRHESRFNTHMAVAEAALKTGDYYKSARSYDLAHTIDPRNPLPLLGRGHALVAAGDYASAARSLQQGIQRFPHIAAFRIDLLELVGQEDAFDVRRADLENRLATSDHHELRFLLGYMEFYSGLPDEGIRNLERAARMAPEGSVIAIFPDLLLGRRPLPPLGRE
jgi:tetratricopeptide (TPR) repeat protein